MWIVFYTDNITECWAQLLWPRALGTWLLHWLQAGPCYPVLGRLWQPLPHPQPLWRHHGKGSIFFMDLVAASRGTMVMGITEMRRTDLLVCLFIPGPLPQPPPSTHTQSSQVTRPRKEAGSPVSGADELRKTSPPPSQSFPLLPITSNCIQTQ